VLSSYLRQVNGMSGGDTVFVQCVSVCLSVCVCAQRTGQLDQFNTVKATDFKFDVHVPRDSPYVTPGRGRCQGHVTPKFLGIKC